MTSRRGLVPAISSISLIGAAVSAVPAAQAATTTYVTAATAGVKVVGAPTYMWGASNAAAGTKVCSQVALSGRWSTSQCTTVQRDQSYAVELTYGKTTPGMNTFRAITVSRSGVITAVSPSTTLTRTRTVPVPPAPSTSTPPPTSTTTPPASTSVTRWTTGVVNVRSSASTSSTIVGTLPAGSQVVGTLTGSWVHVSSPGSYEGRYVSTTVLTSTAPAGSTGDTTPTPTTPARTPTTGVYQGGVLGNSYTLYSGYNGVKVYLAQKALGMKPGPMDSTIGPTTSKNLVAFKKAHGLPATVVIDQQTWDALNPRDLDGVRYPFTIDSWAKTADVMDDAPRDVKIAAMVAFAKAQYGKPYIWGGTGPMGFDCSGLLLQAARAAGMKPVNVSNFTDIRPASDLSNEMWKDGEFQRGSLANVQVGDFIYYQGKDGRVHHVSMYIGNNTVISAVYDKVQYSDLSDNFGWVKKVGVNRAIAF